MVIICTRCGEEVRERRCSCDRAITPPPPASQLVAVIATAAALGAVDEHNIKRAARALRERAS